MQSFDHDVGPKPDWRKAYMSKKSHEPGDDVRAQELLRASARTELEFLKDERKAERRLADAVAALAKQQHRLQRFQSRVEECQKAVTDAEAALLQSQSRRAAGPTPAQD